MTQTSAADESAIREALADVATPALVLLPSRLTRNVEAVVARIGDADRWRPHVKTAKTALAVDVLRAAGVETFKCATLGELELLAARGARDVILAHFQLGANARRLRDAAERMDGTAVSTLAEDASSLAPLAGSRVGVFLDLDVGMHRTGIPIEDVDAVRRVAHAVSDAGLELCGLHAYEGHIGGMPADERRAGTHEIAARVVALAETLLDDGVPIGEIATSGTPAFLHALAYEPLASGPWTHRVSPGTVVYGDLKSMADVAGEIALEPAALVISRVVSRPTPTIVTCDAGHKALSVDTGPPNCVVVEYEELVPLSPSEEHLPLAIPEGGTAPERGELIALVPAHVCPTVNLYDEAVLIDDGRILGLERIAARGHPGPLADAQTL